MSWMQRVALVVVPLAAAASGASAGEMLLRPGVTIRVRTLPKPATGSAGESDFTYTRPHTWLSGRLIAVEPEWLLIAPLDRPVALRVPRSALTRLEVAESRPRAVGALKGFLIGGALGVAGGLLSGDDEPPVRDSPWDCLFGCATATAGEKAVNWGVSGATFGALLGYMAGGGIAWRPVGTAHLDVSVAPQGVRGARLTVRF